jgi:hypothetical protein
MYRHIVVRIEHIRIKDQNQLVIPLGGLTDESLSVYKRLLTQYDTYRGSKRSGYLNVGMSIQTLFVTDHTDNEQCYHITSVSAVPVSHSSPSTILGHLKHPFDSVQAYKTPCETRCL